jgi:SOS-response transcriptional repressor LexA
MNEQQMAQNLSFYTGQLWRFLEKPETASLETAEILLKDVPRNHSARRWGLAREECEGALAIANTVRSSRSPFTRGRAYAYNGATHLRPEESCLNGAVRFFEQAQRAFFEAKSWFSEAVAWWGLGIARHYRAKLMERVGRHHKDLQKDCGDALCAFQSSLDSLAKLANLDIIQGHVDILVNDLKDQVESDLELVTRRFNPENVESPQRPSSPPQGPSVFLGVLPVIRDVIPAGGAEPVSDRMLGYMQADQLKFDGQPFEAQALRGSRVRFLPEYSYFAIKVSGDSMDEAGILPDDYVILRRPRLTSVDYRSGDIVAVVLRDEDNKATLKRILVDEAVGSITLKPESSNPNHTRRTWQRRTEMEEDPNVEVVGIAVAVLKLRPS